MGSSSKKKGSGSGASAAAAAPVAPTMATSTMPDGSNMQYYANPTEVPQSGGLVLPRAGPGMMQGVGLNMYTPPPPPPPPPPRAQLAQTINRGGTGYTTPMGDQGPSSGLYGRGGYRGGRNSR